VELLLHRFRPLRLPGGGLSGQAEPLAWALAALMRPEQLSRAALKLACLRRIAAAELDEIQRFLLVNCVQFYLELTREEAVEYEVLRAQEEDRESRSWR